MYCPDCGLEEIQSNQFCRACGADLRRVRVALEAPDSITASAVTARDEIGRAVAAKIRETETVSELKKVAEDVLPEIEKFLESPEEKRLRRMRVGMLLSSIGFGVAIALSIVGIMAKNEDTLFMAGLGIVAFFIGLGFILNGIFLTVPKKGLSDRSSDAESQRRVDRTAGSPPDLLMPQPASILSSVTDNTTQHLNEKHPVARDAER